MSRASTTTYATSFLVGLGVVAFPASGTVMRSLHPLSDLEWGGLFIGHTVGVLIGSAVGARRDSLRPGLAAIAISAALAIALWLAPSPWAPALLWGGAGTMGVAFGLLAGPLNALPALLYPKRSEGALIALHTFQGLGFAAGPAAVALLGEAWLVLPIVIGSAAIVLLRLPRTPPIVQPAAKRIAPRALLGFATVVLLYAMVEGTFANWAPIFLHEDRGVQPATAALGITTFWGGMLVGRAVLVVLIDRLGARRTWLALPIGMAIVLLLLPFVNGAATGLPLFAVAGLACSAFFPITLALATQQFPGRAPAIASVLVATLAVGIGSGSFLLGALRELASFDMLYRISALYALLLWAIARGIRVRPL